MVPRLTLFLVFLVCVVCEDDINLDNVGRFMSQSPEDLAKTLQLLENPYIAAALVNGDKKHQEKPPVSNNHPMEESNNLLNFLLLQRVADESGTKYKVENPQFSLIPPVVDVKGIEKDPLLGSFFQDTMEDQPPLENARNTDVSSAPSRQIQRAAKQQYESTENNTPLYQQTDAYYYIPPSYYQYV